MASWKKLVVSGSDANLNSLVVSQSVEATSFSGSLLGTASNAVSASYATSGAFSYTSSFSFYAITASYVIGGAVVQTSSYSSYAVTASYVATAQTASWISGSSVRGTVSSSFTASLADSASLAGTASYAQTASWVDTALTASWVDTALTASYISGSNVDGAVANATYAEVAGITISATSASYAETSSYLEGFNGTGITIEVSTPSLTWSLDHSLNTPFPIINIWESGSNEIVQPDTIKFIDTNHTEVTFTAPVKGYAAVAKAGAAVFGNSPNYTASIAYSASYVQLAESASYALLAASASNVETASYSYTSSLAFEAVTASYALEALTASFAISYSINSVTQSNIASASWASASLTASYVNIAQTASYVSGNVVFGAVDSAFSSSVTVTASFAVTASQASSALSASYIQTAQTASYISTAQTASYVTLAQSSSYVSGSVVKGAVTLASTASYISASNISGLVATASFALTSSYATYLLGTASQGISSSYAVTASYVAGGANTNITLAETAPETASVNSLWYNTSELSLYVRYQDTSGSLWWTPSFNGIVLSALTASYTDTTRLADSSSFAISASFVKNAQSASYIGTNNTASYAATASFATDVAGTASYAATASYAKTASFVQNAETASFVQNAETASFVQNAENATTASYVNIALTASYIGGDNTASYAISSLSASYLFAGATVTSASYATSALTASNANTASISETIRVTSAPYNDGYFHFVESPLPGTYAPYTLVGMIWKNNSRTLAITGALAVTPLLRSSGSIEVQGSNTRGGSDYIDFLTVTNTATGSSNKTSTFRKNLTGDIELINDTYSSTLLSIANSGNTTFTGTVKHKAYFCQGRLNTDQSITNASDTVISFIDQFDEYGWWDSVNKQFKPTIPGYYQIAFGIWLENPGTTNGQCNAQARKNGNNSQIIVQYPLNNGQGQSLAGSKLVYFNGSTDYIDFTVYQNSGGSKNIQKGTDDGSGTWFTATLVSAQ